MGLGRRLSAQELAEFGHVSSDTLHRAVVVNIPWLPASFAGITLGRYVLLAHHQPADGSSALLAHELVHVEQWGERGRLGFLRWYLADFASALGRYRRWMLAYRSIEAEVEARDRTRDWINRPR